MWTDEPLPGCYVSVDGVDTWCVFQGDGEPVVFLHGIPTSSYLWRNIQRPLSGRFRTIAVDLLGLGKSSAPSPKHMNLEHQADHLARLLDVLGHERVSIVAHDIGGGVAHHFLARYPERVRARAFMNTVGLSDTWPVATVAGLRRPLAGELMSLAPSRPLLQAEMQRGVWHTHRMQGPAFERYYQPMSTMRGRFRFLRFLRELQPRVVEAALRTHAIEPIPTAILWATGDVFQPVAAGRRLHSLFPGAPFVEVPNAGHFLQEDQPDFIASVLDVFLTGVLHP